MCEIINDDETRAFGLVVTFCDVRLWVQHLEEIDTLCSGLILPYYRNCM